MDGRLRRARCRVWSETQGRAVAGELDGDYSLDLLGAGLFIRPRRLAGITLPRCLRVTYRPREGLVSRIAGSRRAAKASYLAHEFASFRTEGHAGARTNQ